ncbi:hypothetical protein PINS_up014982 [Pythium insidiosum]|nr:hypothetical protein PINS_up014982 [Pythium insidiosum]
MMINDLGERLPTWLVHKIVDTAAMRVACLRDYINQRRMDLLVLSRPKEMVPLGKRVCCVVCTKSFSLVRKKYNCVACGEVICNQCSVHQLVATLAINEHGQGKRKARICVKCSSAAKTRELPRRGSSARGSLLLSEMDHRRSSGSTIASNRQQSRVMSDSSRRSSRSVSQSEQSQGKGDSLSTTDNDGSQRGGTIPHMFQFRSASTTTTPQTYTVDFTTDLQQLERFSSGQSTTPSSSPDDVLSHVDLRAHEDDQGDDGMMHEPTDFDNLLDETALNIHELATGGQIDLGVGKYRKSLQAVDLQRSSSAISGLSSVGDDNRAHDDDDEEEDDDAEFELLPFEEDVQDSIQRHSTQSSLSSASTTYHSPQTIPAEAEELIIQELNPQNSHDGPAVPPRRSVPKEDDDMEVHVVRPVVIKSVSKRSFLGRKSSSSVSSERDAPPPPPPAQVAPDATQQDGSEVPTSPVSRERRATLVMESAAAAIAAATESDEADTTRASDMDNEMMADLQAHLDRMTMISASLKNLHQPEVPTMEVQVATISEIEARAQEEAALAADFLQAMEAANNGSATLAAATAVAAVASKASSSRSGYVSRSSLMLTPLDVRDPRRRRFVAEPVTPVADIHLLREDGSFSSFLSDSSFTAIADVPEGVIAGWIAVHSKTTGKVYYYNESCGTTSWTLPTPDTQRKNAPYMVL